jgi:hypothetical protein
MEFEVRWPTAARWLSLCSIHNELQKIERLLSGMEKSDKPIESLHKRKAELLAKQDRHAASHDRWDHRFL